MVENIHQERRNRCSSRYAYAYSLLVFYKKKQKEQVDEANRNRKWSFYLIESE